MVSHLVFIVFISFTLIEKAAHHVLGWPRYKDFMQQGQQLGSPIARY